MLMLNGIVEYEEAKGLLLIERWQQRNRRAISLATAHTLPCSTWQAVSQTSRMCARERKRSPLVASPPPKTMASAIEVPDAILQANDFSNGYRK